MNNPFADENYEVDYGLKGKDIKLREASKGTGSPAKGPQTSPLSVIATSYKDLEFEPVAPREQNDSSKARFYFDESLERVKAAGYQRHARPQEEFGLIIDGLEGKLTGELPKLSADMLTSWGEWLSLAFERKGDLLVCYLDPVGLVWNGNRYEKQNFSHAGETTFDIKGITSGQWVGLEKFRPDFAQFLYGRRFDQLPAEMREGNKKVHVYLPAEGVAWPVTRGGFNNWYYVVGDYYRYWASRGVRSSQKNSSSGNKGP